MQRRNLREARDEAKRNAHEHQERDWFQKPRITANPDKSAVGPEWSGASWSGERMRGDQGGRDR
jgi:hypothetical protein